MVFFFSPMLRNVRPVKTTCICPWKQLQKCVSHAGCCVDTCSAAAQMRPDSRSAGVSVELDFTLSLCLVGISIFSPCSAGGSGFIIIIFFSLYCFFFHPNRLTDFQLTFIFSQRRFISCFPLRLWELLLCYFWRDLKVFLSDETSQHLHLKRNSSPLHSTPHSLADV